MNIIYTEERRIQVLYIHGSEAPAQEDPRSSFAGRGSEVHGQEIDRKAQHLFKEFFYSTLTIARQYHKIVEVTWLSVIATK